MATQAKTMKTKEMFPEDSQQKASKIAGFIELDNQVSVVANVRFQSHKALGAKIQMAPLCHTNNAIQKATHWFL